MSLLETSSLIRGADHMRFSENYTCTIPALLLPALDSTESVCRRALASGEIISCCLLPELWGGAPPAAGQWGTG